MPIDYEVLNEGHFIHAVASGKVTCDEFVDFEMAHATDDRIRPPVSELLVVEYDALGLITMDDIQKALDQRLQLERKTISHRCGIIVRYGDNHSWNLAKFYEGMVMLHSPEDVIVFGDDRIARTWLGIG